MPAQSQPKSTSTQKEIEVPKCQNIYEDFAEVEELKQLIKKLHLIYHKQIEVELVTERFTNIVDKYQEQPHLLDPYIEEIFTLLLDIVKSDVDMNLKHLTFKLMYLVTKCRGFKVIVRHMPHEVKDMEPVLSMLSAQNVNDHKHWETRYMLLLWLSVVAMIPFDLKRLDNIKTDQQQTTTDVIINIGKCYFEAFDKCQDATAYMLSRFMTRPDVKPNKLPEFLDWSIKRCDTIKQTTTPKKASSVVRYLAGLLYTITLLFKVGKREDLLPYAPQFLNCVMSFNLSEILDMVLRKNNMKIIQRIGLSFLRSTVASWRYQRGNRLLLDNLKNQTSSDNSAGQQSSTTADSGDAEYDVPEEIETVIEQLLIGLKDKSTDVRWSAAKGIGRITGRLPKELADEVVESLMGLFTDSETNYAWHGGCFALAELGRRGLLLPSRLESVLPVVKKALMYEELRGYFSVGTHVRDAACYVCWAFARAYEPEEMKAHVQSVANSLIVTTLFDREVNVRRAAAAAFQENVGRQGQFPHGIDIITTCDYFAVGLRQHCYTELCLYVCKFPEYRHYIIDHLVSEKAVHWDVSIREQASQALSTIVPLDPDYFSKNVLHRLIEASTSKDLNTRSGSMLALAQVIHSFYSIATSDSRTLNDVIDKSIQAEMVGLINKIKSMGMLKGSSGDIMKNSVCCFIEKLSRSKFDLNNDSSTIEYWHSLLNDCLLQNDSLTQSNLNPETVVAAISAFMEAYYIADGVVINVETCENFLTHYFEQLDSNLECTRSNHAMALSVLPLPIIKGRLNWILRELLKRTKPLDKFGEARSHVVKAVTSICLAVGVELKGDPRHVICEENFNPVYSSLLTATEDYTSDARGDVGSRVREAAVDGLYQITSLVVKTCPDLLQPTQVSQLFTAVAQQCLEKIDRTRGLAGHTFVKLLYHSPPIPHIPNQKELEDILPRSGYVSTMRSGEIVYEIKKSEKLAHGDADILDTNWSLPSVTFPVFTKLLDIPIFTRSIVTGVVVAVGGLTESLVKCSEKALNEQLWAMRNRDDLESFYHFTDSLLHVFRNNKKNNRVVIPMFKALDGMLSSGLLDLFAEDTHSSFPIELFDLTKAEIYQSTNPQKIIASIQVFCGLLLFKGSVLKKTLYQLLIFLCHKYPLVRKTTAEKFYMSLVTYDGLVEHDEDLDEASSIISETEWDGPVSEIRPLRNRLCELFGVATPQLVKSTKQ